MTVSAVILAAGTGTRLTGEGDDGLPKSLLKFDGTSLLARHLEVLQKLHIADVTLVVGYRAGDIRSEISSLSIAPPPRIIDNPRYREGSVVSFWSAAEVLNSSNDILIMDADVLYHPSLLSKIIRRRGENCFSFDRDFVPGDEPVKICLRENQIVEFRKLVDVEYDDIGEWPGFLLLTAAMSAKAMSLATTYVKGGRSNEPYEEVIRDLLLDEPEGTFSILDATGIPWIEIDFPEDVERAEREILPRIRSLNE